MPSEPPQVSSPLNASTVLGSSGQAESTASRWTVGQRVWPPHACQSAAAAGRARSRAIHLADFNGSRTPPRAGAGAVRVLHPWHDAHRNDPACRPCSSAAPPQSP